jgi:hypothetical protein
MKLVEITSKGQLLAQLYRKQGKDELAAAVENLDRAFTKLNYQANLLWAMREHRCPICDKAVVDPVEYDFMEVSGMCGTCDHVLADVE